MNTLQWTANYFNSKGIENPRASAEILLAHVLGSSRIDLYLRHDQPLHASELESYRKLIKRRVQHEPVAYIIEQKEFWSLELKVTPEVLIPRPETECLVEMAIDYLKTFDRTTEVPRVLELGTGSGAISIALAHEQPEACYLASDVSMEAVQLARENARRILKKEKIHFFAGQWFEALGNAKPDFDLVISNPPYICDADISQLAAEISAYEPHRALSGGEDGLRSVAELIRKAPFFLKPGGLLIIEIGYNQKAAVQKLAQARECYSSIGFKKDYGGHNRVVTLKKNENTTLDRKMPFMDGH
jgi:release factor glutamine methyltransferase